MVTLETIRISAALDWLRAQSFSRPGWRLGSSQTTCTSDEVTTNSGFSLPSQVAEFARVIIECRKVLIAVLIIILLHQNYNNQDQPEEETQS